MRLGAFWRSRKARAAVLQRTTRRSTGRAAARGEAEGGRCGDGPAGRQARLCLRRGVWAFRQRAFGRSVFRLHAPRPLAFCLQTSVRTSARNIRPEQASRLVGIWTHTSPLSRDGSLSCTSSHAPHTLSPREGSRARDVPTPVRAMVVAKHPDTRPWAGGVACARCGIHAADALWRPLGKPSESSSIARYRPADLRAPVHPDFPSSRRTTPPPPSWRASQPGRRNCAISDRLPNQLQNWLQNRLRALLRNLRLILLQNLRLILFQNLRTKPPLNLFKKHAPETSPRLAYLVLHSPPLDALSAGPGFLKVRPAGCERRHWNALQIFREASQQPLNFCTPQTPFSSIFLDQVQTLPPREP